MAEKILLVDDDMDTLRLVGLMLQRQGYEVRAASNGPQALSMAQIDQPDLILLDIMMPGMSGHEICEKIKDDPEMKKTYIIMVSARTQQEDRMQAASVGADEYVTKPYDVRLIRERVQKVLEINPI